MADTLDTLPAGRWAAIRAVTHSQRQRLLELGFIPGTTSGRVQISPLGDPVAYEVLDAVIALRRCDARGPWNGGKEGVMEQRGRQKNDPFL